MEKIIRNCERKFKERFRKTGENMCFEYIFHFLIDAPKTAEILTKFQEIFQKFRGLFSVILSNSNGILEGFHRRENIFRMSQNFSQVSYFWILWEIWELSEIIIKKILQMCASDKTFHFLINVPRPVRILRNILTRVEFDKSKFQPQILNAKNLRD